MLTMYTVECSHCKRQVQKMEFFMNDFMCVDCKEIAKERINECPQKNISQN